MDSKTPTRPLKVLIVGAGISGLTLAKALEEAPVNIEYLVLDDKDTVAPQLGAGIALCPNGCRILDQLGVYDDLERQVHPVESSGVHLSNGNSLFAEPSDTGKVVGARLSYPLSWIERRAVLKALYTHLKRKHCILINKKVLRVNNHKKEDGITVQCTDGSSYDGDVVIGADGVRSVIRSEMWRAVEEKLINPSISFDVAKERSGMLSVLILRDNLQLY